MFRKLVINTLSVGKIYEIYTRYLFKKIKELGIDDIIFCVTSDSDFSDKLVDSNIRVEFNLLQDHSIDNSRASTGVYRSTVFKYYLKSLAIKNAAIKFPDHSILHIDCDMIPDEKFNLESIYKNSDSGIYCNDLGINPETDCLAFHGKNYQPYQKVKNKHLIDLLNEEKINCFQ